MVAGSSAGWCPQVYGYCKKSLLYTDPPITVDRQGPRVYGHGKKSLFYETQMPTAKSLNDRHLAYLDGDGPEGVKQAKSIEGEIETGKRKAVELEREKRASVEEARKQWRRPMSQEEQNYIQGNTEHGQRVLQGKDIEALTAPFLVETDTDERAVLADLYWRCQQGEYPELKTVWVQQPEVIHADPVKRSVIRLRFKKLTKCGGFCGGVTFQSVDRPTPSWDQGMKADTEETLKAADWWAECVRLASIERRRQQGIMPGRQPHGQDDALMERLKQLIEEDEERRKRDREYKKRMGHSPYGTETTGYGSIASRLNNEGFTTSTGKKFYAQMVKNLIARLD